MTITLARSFARSTSCKLFRGHVSSLAFTRPARAGEGLRGGQATHDLDRHGKPSCPRVVAPPAQRLNRGIENALVPRFSFVLHSAAYSAPRRELS